MGPKGPILIPSLSTSQEKSSIDRPTNLMVEFTHDLNINGMELGGGNYNTAVQGQTNAQKMQKSHKKSV